MSIEYTTVKSDHELEQVLQLQRENLYKNTSADYQQDQGFTTVEHNFELLQQMNNALPQIIAKEGDKVVGYALVMPPSFADLIPELVPMFAVIKKLNWKEKPIRDQTFYVMGQICVATDYRGQGVFDGLYQAHKQHLASDFELCVTEVAVRNRRSMRAHERVGFQSIHTYQDHTDVWNVVVWDWQ